MLAWCQGTERNDMNYLRNVAAAVYGNVAPAGGRHRVLPAGRVLDGYGQPVGSDNHLTSADILSGLADDVPFGSHNWPAAHAVRYIGPRCPDGSESWEACDAYQAPDDVQARPVHPRPEDTWGY